MSLFVAGAALTEIWVEIAGAQNVLTFTTKCVSELRKVTSANGRVRDDEFMLGTWPDDARVGRALKMTLQLFSANFS